MDEIGTIEAGEELRYVDLRKIFGPEIERLPWVIRILAENVLRRSQKVRDDAAPFAAWLARGSSNIEIPFYPGRILMHDTTCGPALVDMAGMRDALAESGVDPSRLAPVVPIDVSIDHSVAVDAYARPDALSRNMATEMDRNRERYRLMKWATRAFPGLTVHAPGTGIMHTMNLEQLSTVITTEKREDAAWAVPDTLIGTDSHTPMVNGIGVLGWGVGGLEAECVMLGMPVMLRVPEVIGVRFTGSLLRGSLSTDLALVVTERLRRMNLDNPFVEFFGPGLPSLSAGERAVVANMAPEYGASTGYFPVDARTLAYLRETGRDPGLIRRAERVAKAQALWFDGTAEPRYTDILEIDLDKVGASIAGPRRPQDRLAPSETRAAIEKDIGRKLGTAKGAGTPPDGAVAIAAVTSCTNTSDPRLLLAAGLVARKARLMGLKPPPWVKTSLGPGSPAASRYLARAGLLDDLAAIGFDIVGFGCTTCIGNSGVLPEAIEGAMADGKAAVAVLSGNRNFPGRVHPKLDLGFLASPPLVVAFGLAGDVDRDILADPIRTSPSGAEVFLADLWPDGAELDEVLRQATDPDDFASAFSEAERNPDWAGLEAPESPRFPWNPASTYLCRPPFTALGQKSRLGTYAARPLLALGNDITTDHISPAGQIAPDSDAGSYLLEHGEDRDALNVFAARRGHWEVMRRGLYTNKAVRNLLCPGGPPGWTTHAPSGKSGPVWLVADRYREEGVSVVIVAGERYGAGSSRDWAAKGAGLLGARAVLASSFERIHRSNLIGMGVLPLLLPEALSPVELRLGAGSLLLIRADAGSLEPRGKVSVTVQYEAGDPVTFAAIAAVETAQEVETLRDGGAIPFILRRLTGGN